MEVTYKFSVDAAYYRTLIGRYYRQRPFLFHLRVQFGFLALIITGAFVLAFDSPPETKWLIGGRCRRSNIFRWRRRYEVGKVPTL